MITIVGLGTGTLEELPIGVYNLLQKSDSIKYFRTKHHPVVAELEEKGVTFSTFDYLYEQEESFAKVYDKISSEIIKLEEPVIYGVPGHPMVAEDSVMKIIEKSKLARKEYKVIPAISFLDYIFTSLEIDPVEGLSVIDGLQIETQRPVLERGNVITQVYNKQVASDVKLSLMEHYPDEYPITILRWLGIEGKEEIITVPLFKIDRVTLDHLTTLYVPAKKDAISIARFPLDSLVEVMAKLRAEDGCPWDREQSHVSLKKYLLEESYEVIEAIDDEDMNKLQEELGDLLLQIVFHSQIATENEYFNINDVIMEIKEKLIRRHPHVFGTIQVSESGQVVKNWEEIKKKEKETKGDNTGSILDGITKTLPGLVKAEKIQKKAAQVGFDWPDYQGALLKIDEEVKELKTALNNEKQEDIAEELGDLFFATVNLARFFNVNSEEALDNTIKKFTSRFRFIEEEMRKRNLDFKETPLEELDKIWDLAKKDEKEHISKKIR